MPSPLPFNQSDFLLSGGFLATEPGKLFVGWGKWERSASAPPGKAAFFAPDFFLCDPRPWWIPEHSAEVSGDALAATLSAHRIPAPAWRDPSWEKWQHTFETISQRFRTSPLQKAVPAVFQCTQLEVSADIREGWLKNLLSLKDAVRPYGLWNANEGILGATPEVLFKRNSARDFDTMALASTRKRVPGPTPEWDDPKENHEHQLVVNDIAETLQRFGRAEIQARRILSLTLMEHLLTPIRLEANEDYPFETIARALHPTPALGTYPRSEGWKWLADLPGGQDRARFGAPFGVALPDGQAQALVAIRNVQWQGKAVSLGSGCGVVEGSDCRKEWEELKLKRLSVRKMLGLPN